MIPLSRDHLPRWLSLLRSLFRFYHLPIRRGYGSLTWGPRRRRNPFFSSVNDSDIEESKMASGEAITTTKWTTMGQLTACRQVDPMSLSFRTTIFRRIYDLSDPQIGPTSHLRSTVALCGKGLNQGRMAVGLNKSKQKVRRAERVDTLRRICVYSDSALSSR